MKSNYANIYGHRYPYSNSYVSTASYKVS